ncbi:LAT2 domain-containing protein [Puntigrus tetrazona]|uniref:LAT2 domain-containing protein n=1 Tax=Puntigrus tetrazona TaxID=1606681 RepID=UPI001C8A9F61|nr:LAT2 domain-containing protein [Puntigrus tetrazona]
MIEVQSQQGVVLAIISVLSLGCIYALCLCCGKKSSMQQEDNDLYDQDDFSQDSEYAESRKHKPALRPNQSKMPSTSRLSSTNRPNSETQWSYQNLPDVEKGILEPTYVDPIPNSLYANEDDTDTGTYENVFPTSEVRHDSDSCNYENWDNRYEDDEPDYVNDVRK